ncbi:zinc metalloproteinase nas-13-like [Gigantopelta aegis]|uniref:zinc metalloproteinase nas-13-like n=1 Tax=Gigantopelta aegis TaxID=1735272 RepID=UPI001B88BB50|nr:zinc metalloproteinase nas-13-like [Gigantopelta aegis]
MRAFIATHHLFVDASLEGWGAHLSNQTTSGLWSPVELGLHINLLELLAVYYAILHWRQMLTEASLMVATDSTTAAAYINRMEFDFFYDEKNAVVKLEYDMEYTMEDWKILKELNKTDSVSRKKRKAIRSLNSRWTANTLPYEIEANTFTTRQRAEIMAAIDEWQTFTCLTFRPARSSDTNRIRFQNGGGCSSFVGMIRRRSQSVTLARGCRVKGIIVHEVGHAVGFHHEQTRPDRDNFVSIVRRNIPSNLLYNFQKYSAAVINTHSVPYDYLSVMHYGSTAFSTNGQRTIITKNPAFQNIIGNRRGLSFRDIKLANIMYSCAASSGCAKMNCDGEGFVGKDCKCWCPGNPVKYCDGGGEIKTGNGNGGGNGETGGGTDGGGTDGGSGGGETGDCMNMNQNCEFWASIGECDKNPGYMKELCKPACDVCNAVKPASCEDMNRNCDYWQGKGYCQQEFVMYMRENCPKACGVCESDVAGNNASDDDNLSNTTSTEAPSTSSSLSTCFLSITFSLILLCAVKV